MSPRSSRARKSKRRLMNGRLRDSAKPRHGGLVERPQKTKRLDQFLALAGGDQKADLVREAAESSAPT